MTPLSLALIASCTCTARPGAPRDAALIGAWRDYRRVFIQDDGRVVDRSADGISTSEGQAYAMIRAVWVDDRDGFDRVLRWTTANLQGGVPGRLPAWKWGQRPDGTWGVIDENPASDADLWMAYALLIAGEQWAEPQYGEYALGLLAPIWEKEVLRVGERWLLLPGPWAAEHTPVQINPSYYLPFAFRLFAEADPTHPWGALVDDSYWMFEATAAAGAPQGTGLPPDWAWYDPEAAAFVPPPPGQEGKDAYGYEAMRVPWTLAAEIEWYDEPRARAQLDRMDGLLERWHRDGAVPAVINPDGGPGRDYPSLGLYGAVLPAWGITSPDDARSLYEHVIFPARTVSGWGDTEDYYAHNWVWFGLALWGDLADPPRATPERTP